MSVQSEIARLKHELHAQKGFAKLPNGALDLPESSPTASWSGSVNLNSGQNPLARWRATFTRTDGKTATPLVDFAFDYAYSPTRKDYLESRGNTVTAKDFNARTDANIFSGIYSASGGTVQFDIWLSNGFNTGYATTNFSLTVQALSPAVGTLTLVKV